jgi:hypothetical protein
MAETRPTYRYAAMLLVGSVMAVTALVVTGLESARTPAAQATASAEIVPADDTDFRRWAADSEDVDGKGRLIGEIERNGKMVELRELPPGADPVGEQAGDGETLAEPGPGDPAVGQSDR